MNVTMDGHTDGQTTYGSNINIMHCVILCSVWQELSVPVH